MPPEAAIMIGEYLIKFANKNIKNEN